MNQENRISMEQDYESWQDVEHLERQNILPSFEPKEPQQSRLTTITKGFGTTAFVLAIIAALIEDWWLWAIFLLGMFVVYQRTIE